MAMTFSALEIQVGKLSSDFVEASEALVADNCAPPKLRAPLALVTNFNFNAQYFESTLHNLDARLPQTALSHIPRKKITLYAAKLNMGPPRARRVKNESALPARVGRCLP